MSLAPSVQQDSRKHQRVNDDDNNHNDKVSTKGKIANKKGNKKALMVSDSNNKNNIDLENYVCEIIACEVLLNSIYHGWIGLYV